MKTLFVKLQVIYHKIVLYFKPGVNKQVKQWVDEIKNK